MQDQNAGIAVIIGGVEYQPTATIYQRKASSERVGVATPGQSTSFSMLGGSTVVESSGEGGRESVVELSEGGKPKPWEMHSFDLSFVDPDIEDRFQNSQTESRISAMWGGPCIITCSLLPVTITMIYFRIQDDKVNHLEI